MRAVVERHPGVLVRRLSKPVRALSSGPHGGEIAGGLGLRGAGTGLLTADDVRDVVAEEDGGVRSWVKTGIGAHPTWAARPPADEVRTGALSTDGPPNAGTINAVCAVRTGISPDRAGTGVGNAASNARPTTMPGDGGDRRWP